MDEKKKATETSALFAVKNKILATDRKIQSLHEKKNKLKEKLQRDCAHEFIVEFDGYEGSYSEDYSDKYEAERICVVCALNEHGETVYGGAKESPFEHYSCDGGYRFKKLTAKPQCRVASRSDTIRKAVQDCRSLLEISGTLTEKNHCYNCYSQLEVHAKVNRASEKAQEASSKVYREIMEEEMKKKDK